MQKPRMLWAVLLLAGCLAPAGAGESMPLPPAADIRTAESEVRQVFKESYNKRGDDAKRVLAEQLIEQAKDPTNRPAAVYALLSEGARMGAKADAVDLVITAADALGNHFGQETIAARLEWLDAVSRAAREDTEASLLANALIALAEEAVRAESFDLAEKIAREASGIARRVKGSGLYDATKSLRDRIDETGEQYERAVKAVKTLKALPDDPAANRTIGVYVCLFRNEWDKGLPYLAKGDDTLLQAAANKDLANPQDADTMAKVGEAWFELIEKEKTNAGKRGLMNRAEHWYQQALPGLGGLAKAAVEKRLETLAEASAGPAARGMVRSGNVALAKDGATATAPSRPEELIDGNFTAYDGGSGFASGGWPCEFTVTFPDVYALQQISFLLWDGNQRSYQYKVEVSPDGKRWLELVDRSKGAWRSWQHIEFRPRPVKAVRVTGLHNTDNTGFHIVELEAYCKPPKTQRRPKYPSEEG